MKQRNFVAGALLGSLLTAAALLGIAAAVQDDGMPGVPAGEHAFTAQDLAFVTASPGEDPMPGRLMVRVDGEWHDTMFEPKTVPAE